MPIQKQNKNMIRACGIQISRVWKLLKFANNSVLFFNRFLNQSKSKWKSKIVIEPNLFVRIFESVNGETVQKTGMANFVWHFRIHWLVSKSIIKDTYYNFIHNYLGDNFQRKDNLLLFWLILYVLSKRKFKPFHSEQRVIRSNKNTIYDNLEPKLFSSLIGRVCDLCKFSQSDTRRTESKKKRKKKLSKNKSKATELSPFRYSTLCFLVIFCVCVFVCVPVCVYVQFF